MEACAVFGTRRVCAQEAVRASAKRLVVRFDITFADSTDVRRGTYALEFGVERLRADGAVWEQIAGPRRTARQHGRFFGAGRHRTVEWSARYLRSRSRP